MKNIEELPSWLYIDAVRYCIGRRSYQVGATTEWLIANWERLPDHARRIIKNDVESEFERAESMEDPSVLGDPCDVEDWKKVRQLWK